MKFQSGWFGQPTIGHTFILILKLNQPNSGSMLEFWTSRENICLLTEKTICIPCWDILLQLLSYHGLLLIKK